MPFQSPQREKERNRKVFGSGQRTEKTEKHECAGDSNFNWFTGNGPYMLGKGIGKIKNERKNQDYSDYSIVETEKRPEYHMLALVRKARKNLYTYDKMNRYASEFGILDYYF